MGELGFFAYPLLGFCLLCLTGAGFAAALGRSLPLDVQAALTPLLGAAAFGIGSSLLPLGIPVQWLCLATFAVGIGVTVARRNGVRRLLGAARMPLAIVLVAGAIGAGPNLVRGDWSALSLANADSYFWVSQARALLDGAPPGPASVHPNRVAVEDGRSGHWATALPAADAEVAWLSHSDPADVYGVVAVLVFLLTPLAGFVAARGCLGWSSGLATVAALALAVDASRIFANAFAFQAQNLGVGLGFAAAAVLRIALERNEQSRLQILAAMLAAGALAGYRLGFAPFLLGLFVAVVAAYVISTTPWHSTYRHAARPAVGFLGFFAVLGASSLIGLAQGLPHFLTRQLEASGRFIGYGTFSNPLGLFPVYPLQAHVLEGWNSLAGPVWLVLANVLAVVLFVVAVRRLRRVRPPGSDFLLGSALLIFVGFCVAVLSTANPYLSFKLLAYGTPLLVLLVFSPLATVSRPRGVSVLAGVGLALSSAVAASATELGYSVARSRSSSNLSGITEAAKRLPQDDVITVRLDRVWDQAWAAYYLSDRRLSVVNPSAYLSDESEPRTALISARPPVNLLTEDTGGPALWRRGGLALYQLRPCLRGTGSSGATPCFEPRSGGSSSGLAQLAAK
jgi:hypothetical protein